MKLAIESHKKEVKEKEKAERAEQQRQRYVQKTGRTRDQAAVFGVKGAGGGGEPDDGDRQFSNYGKAKAGKGMRHGSTYLRLAFLVLRYLDLNLGIFNQFSLGIREWDHSGDGSRWCETRTQIQRILPREC